jgi:hypothetical protein
MPPPVGPFEHRGREKNIGRASWCLRDDGLAARQYISHLSQKGQTSSVVDIDFGGREKEKRKNMDLKHERFEQMVERRRWQRDNVSPI